MAKNVPAAALMPMIKTRAAVKKIRLAGAGCAARCNELLLTLVRVRK
jgi:hypothetical protein